MPRVWNRDAFLGLFDIPLYTDWIFYLMLFAMFVGGRSVYADYTVVDITGARHVQYGAAFYIDLAIALGIQFLLFGVLPASIRRGVRGRGGRGRTSQDQVAMLGAKERADVNERMAARGFLPGVDLNHADLRGVDLLNADLRGVDLLNANLKGANLRGANLTYANLTNANLTRANLFGAYLFGANLTGATMPDGSIHP